MVVSMYLYPSDGGLIGPIMSTEIVENGVLIKGSFPIGAFGTAADISHTKLRISSRTHVHLANRTLVGLCSKFWPPLYVLPIMYRVQLTQLLLAFQWALPTLSPVYSMSFFTTNCGFPFDSGLLTL